jgi:3-phytase
MGANTVSFSVAPTVETTPVAHSGDAADDPAIWVHPTDPSLSTIIGTDKQGAVIVYNLNGTIHQALNDGDMNNVDVRYGFEFGGESIDIVGMSDRGNNTLRFYKMEASTRNLVYIGSVPVTGFAANSVYGFTFYKSATSGKLYAFVNENVDESPQVHQYEIRDNSGVLAGTLQNRNVPISPGTLCEGMVADDETGFFYIAEEDFAIHKYGAEPDSSYPPTIVASVGSHLVADIEGLTIYYGLNGTGYLIASSQGNNTYAIYDRATGAFVASFKISSRNGIDSVSDTDGIDVISTPLGPSFPFGMFIAQDGENSGANQNFKIVPWKKIAIAASPNLQMETEWSPRPGAAKSQIEAGKAPGD